MSDGDIPAHKSIYRIELRGRLDASWAEWCDGMAIASVEKSDGSVLTTLTGPVADQSALRGLLCRLWDLNLAVISVTRTANDADKEE